MLCEMRAHISAVFNVMACLGCSSPNTTRNDALATTTSTTSTAPSTTTIPAGISGQWIGNASNDGGLFLPGPCGEQHDLQLTIEQSGNTLSGTVIFTVRSYTNQTGSCADLPPPGTQYLPSTLNGTISDSRVQFGATDQGYPPSAPGHTLPFTGTVEANRMSGTACASNDCPWAVSRQ